MSAFIEASGETDVLRVDGQFYMAEWDGSDGTFISNETPGVRFFLHSPLLERLEADTWRAEGESNSGTLTGLSNPISQRKKFLLPTANTFGTAKLTIENGNPVSLSYSLDFAATGAPGFEGTNLESVQFNVINLNSDGVTFGVGQTYEVGVNDDAVPFGFNTSLTPGSHPEKVLKQRLAKVFLILLSLLCSEYSYYKIFNALFKSISLYKKKYSLSGKKSTYQKIFPSHISWCSIEY